MKSTASLNLKKPPKDSFDNVICTLFKGLSFPENACPNGNKLANELCRDFENSKEPVWKCRYLVTMIGFLVILSAGIHRTIMGVVIVAMVNNTATIQNSKEKSESCPDLTANSTDDATLHFYRTEGEFTWSPQTQGVILACFFFGQMFTFIPAGRFAERFGCKWILVGAILTISILTMLIPPFSRLNTTAVIVIQTLRGFAQGIPEPCIYILMANWLPKTERGCLFSLILTANSLGPALGNAFAGYISESPLGWQYAFYTVGCLGLALAAYIFFFIAESPKEHSSITKAELHFILSQQETTLSRKRPKLPWRQMLTCIPLYAYIIGQFGRCWKFSQFWSVNSTFLGTILHYPIGQNGLFSAIPYLVSFLTSSIASLITGYIEKKKVVSTDFLRKFCLLTAGLIYSLCLLGTYISGCKRDLSVIFSILSLGLSGMGTAAVVTLQDMSPTFSGTLASITATVGYMAGALLPLMVGNLTNEMQTLEQWNKVFFISIAIVMSSTIIFVIFGSTEIQPWNFVEEEEDKKKYESRQENDEKVEMTRF